MAHFGAKTVARPVQIGATDVYLMAVRLLARHGSAAQDVAAFTEMEHAMCGDATRREAWRGVRSTLDDMLARRLSVTGIRIH